MESQTQPTGWRAGLNRNVVVLGLVSFFTDISSEMLVPIRFIFLVRWLGTPLALAGLIEGISEAAASLLKVAVGKRSDRVARRGPMIILGYSLSNLAKPLIGFVSTWQPALALLLVDRVGKSIRGAPRDTIIADSVPAEYRGKAFGFHRSMDTFGAALGPLATMLVLNRTGEDLSAVFRWTIVPGLISILIIPLFLREPARKAPVAAEPAAPSSAEPLGARFWAFAVIWAIFSLGNSSDSFIFLRSFDIDAQLMLVPLFYAGFNIAYALAATPLGSLSDVLGRLPLLLFSLVVFGFTYLGWSVASQPWHIAELFVMYGLYYAGTEGVARAFVADLVPKGRRGAALGWFTALSGLATLPANLMAAYLWNNVGKQAPFVYGAGLAFGAALLLLIGYRWLRGPRVEPAP